MKMSEEQRKEIYEKPLTLGRFLQELYTEFPKFYFIATDEGKWFLLRVNYGKKSQNYIITKRSLRNESVGFKRLKVVKNQIRSDFNG